jgi:hypothetical protein
MQCDTQCCSDACADRDRKAKFVLPISHGMGNAVLLGKFSDELEKETNSNQRDSEATAPTHEPRMPDRSP